MLKKIVVIMAVLLLSVGLYAETTATNVKPSNMTSSTSGGSGFQMNAAIGAANINGITYTQIVMRPDLDFGGWGIGLDINLEFDKDGNLRKGEWDSWQAVVNKIRYFRIGEKGNKFFFKIGNLEDVYIGHRTIMDGFSNNIFAPDARMLGIQLDIDFKWFGFESFVDNFLDYDIVVGRLYFRPLLKTGIPLLKNLEIGATYAKDFDNLNEYKSGEDKYKYGDNDLSSDDVEVYGVDLGIPLPSLGIIQWKWFADLNHIKSAGNGFTTGIMGKLIGIFNFQIEFNRFGSEYISPYFDYYYLSNRGIKNAALAGVTEAYNGWKARLWRNFSIVAKNDFTILWEVRDSEKENPFMMFAAHLDKKLLFNKLELDFIFTKKNIENFKDAFRVEDTDSLVTFKVGYEIAENVMLTAIYTKSFVVNDVGVIEGQDSTVIQTQLRF